MSVRIRCSRIGKKKAPFFRVVAIDKRAKRDGRFLENLGTYNPLTGTLVQFHQERIDAWVKRGALLSDTVKKLQKLYKNKNVDVSKKTKAPVKPVADDKIEKDLRVKSSQDATQKKSVNTPKDIKEKEAVKKESIDKKAE